jgi:acetyl esterase
VVASGTPVSPQAQAVLDGRHAAGVPPVWRQTPSEARAGFAPVREMIGPGPSMHAVRDVLVPGRAGPVPVRVYSPVPEADSPGVVVYYHGGGWVIGSVDDWDACVRALAAASGCTTVSVDYRLAPEHRFPAATDDCYDAYLWACSASGLGGAGKTVVVAGDSAGGNLAAVTCLRALHDGAVLPALQVLIYPVVDCDLDRTSYREHDGTDFILNRADMAWFWDQYAPGDAARHNPYASPLRAPSLAGLPPAWVLTAEHDPLRDEGYAYAERLSAAGVAVEHRHYGAQIHGFVTMVNIMDDADRAVADAGAAIRSVTAS